MTKHFSAADAAKAKADDVTPTRPDDRRQRLARLGFLGQAIEGVNGGVRKRPESLQVVVPGTKQFLKEFRDLERASFFSSWK